MIASMSLKSLFDFFKFFVTLAALYWESASPPGFKSRGPRWPTDGNLATERSAFLSAQLWWSSTRSHHSLTHGVWHIYNNQRHPSRQTMSIQRLLQNALFDTPLLLLARPTEVVPTRPWQLHRKSCRIRERIEQGLSSSYAIDQATSNFGWSKRPLAIKPSLRKTCKPHFVIKNSRVFTIDMGRLCPKPLKWIFS